jgi:hypothetical protein
MLQKLINWFKRDRHADFVREDREACVGKPKHPAMTAPIKRVSKQKTEIKQEPCQTEVKIPRGWKKADGRTRHVKTGKVDLILRDGTKNFDISARSIAYIWSTEFTVTPYDIIAYRVSKPAKKRVTVKKRGKK